MDWLTLARALIWAVVLCSGTLANAQGTQTTLPVGAPDTVRFYVQPGQTSATLPIDVSEVKRLNIFVLAPVPGAVVQVLDPAGTVVNGEWIDGSTLTPALPGGYFRSPWVQSPASGQWRVRATFPPAQTKTVIEATVSIESDYRAGLFLSGERFRQGTGTAVMLFLLNGASPLVGMTPQMSVKLPNGSTFALSPRDDGTRPDRLGADGVYTDTFLFAAVGIYEFSASVSFRTAGGALVTRRARAVAVVEPPKLDLTGIGMSQDNGTDCVAAARVNLSTSLLTSGTVIATATLLASNGNTLQQSTSVVATPGSLQMSIPFSADEMRNSLAVNGPYIVSKINVLVSARDGTTLEASATNAATTPAWALSQLCLPKLAVSSTSTMTPILRNGYVDVLRAAIGITVATASSYQISFRVTDGARKEVGAYSTTRTLSAGTNTVSLDVPAFRMQTSDGPFQIETVLIVGSSASLTAPLVPSNFSLSRWQFYPTYAGDLNGDGSVDVADRDLLLTFRNTKAVSPGDRRDITRDGKIDLLDVQALQRLACAAGTCPRVP